MHSIRRRNRNASSPLRWLLPLVPMLGTPLLLLGLLEPLGAGAFGYLLGIAVGGGLAWLLTEDAEEEPAAHLKRADSDGESGAGDLDG